MVHYFLLVNFPNVLPNSMAFSGYPTPLLRPFDPSTPTLVQSGPAKRLICRIASQSWLGTPRQVWICSFYALRNGDVTSKNGASSRKNRDFTSKNGSSSGENEDFRKKKRIWPWVILILPRVSLGFGKPKSFQQSPYSGGHSRCRAVQACAAVREESARWVHSIPGGPGARLMVEGSEGLSGSGKDPTSNTYMSLKWLDDEIIHSKSQYPGTKRPPTVYSHHHRHHPPSASSSTTSSSSSPPPPPPPTISIIIDNIIIIIIIITTTATATAHHQHHHRQHHHHHHHHHRHHPPSASSSTTASPSSSSSPSQPPQHQSPRQRHPSPSSRQVFSSSPISISSNEETITSPRFSFNANL